MKRVLLALVIFPGICLAEGKLYSLDVKLKVDQSDVAIPEEVLLEEGVETRVIDTKDAQGKVIVDVKASKGETDDSVLLKFRVQKEGKDGQRVLLTAPMIQTMAGQEAEIETGNKDGVVLLEVTPTEWGTPEDDSTEWEESDLEL